MNWFDCSGVRIWNRFEWDSNGYSEGLTLESTLSMELWFSLQIIAENTGLLLGGDVLDLKWAAGGWLFNCLGGSGGSSPWWALNLFVFILILGGSNLGPYMMQESALC